jgi:hypothetical protein
MRAARLEEQRRHDGCGQQLDEEAVEGGEEVEVARRDEEAQVVVDLRPTECTRTS